MKIGKSIVAIMACSMALGGTVNMTTIRGNYNNIPHVLRAGEISASVTYDFTQIDGFSSWSSSSYSAHTVEYDEGTVSFVSASRQTGTITDMPVTKGNTVTFAIKEGLVIKSCVFTCKQWGSKTQTITLNTSTDGTNFTPTENTSSSFSLSVDDVGEGVTAIQFTFNSTSNQVGIESLQITYDDPTATPESAAIKEIKKENTKAQLAYSFDEYARAETFECGIAGKETTTLSAGTESNNAALFGLDEEKWNVTYVKNGSNTSSIFNDGTFRLYKSDKIVFTYKKGNIDSMEYSGPTSNGVTNGSYAINNGSSTKFTSVSGEIPLNSNNIEITATNAQIRFNTLKFIVNGEYSFSDVKLNFGAVIPEEKITALTNAGVTVNSYGVTVARKSKLDDTTINAALEAESENVKTVEKTYDVSTLVKTDATGLADTGDYVTFTANVNFPDDETKYTETLVAVAYLKDSEGNYIYLTEKECSVASLAQEYIDSDVYASLSDSIKNSLSYLASL